MGERQYERKHQSLLERLLRRNVCNADRPSESVRSSPPLPRRRMIRLSRPNESMESGSTRRKVFEYVVNPRAHEQGGAPSHKQLHMLGPTCPRHKNRTVLQDGLYRLSRTSFV